MRLLILFGAVSILLAISAFFIKRAMKRHLKETLGREINDYEVNSISTWLEATPERKSGQGAVVRGQGSVVGGQYKSSEMNLPESIPSDDSLTPDPRPLTPAPRPLTTFPVKSVDELVPLTAEEMKLLESRRFSSSIGCGIFALIVFAVAAGLAVLNLVSVVGSFTWVVIFGVVALPFLAVGLLMTFGGPTEDKNVTLDIAQGKKRRIVAPIERKDLLPVSSWGNIVSPDTLSPDTQLFQEKSLELNLNEPATVQRHPWEGKSLKSLGAPLKSEDFLNYDQFEDAVRQNNRWMRSGKHNYGSYVYTITVQGFTFTISEEDYLTGFRKGDFVEFLLCPNSKRFITLPEEVREEHDNSFDSQRF